MIPIEVTFPGGKKVDAKYGDFVIKTDQPKESGGDNSAPEPFALFLAGLATCAGYYAMAFCQSRDIPTENLKVIQKGIWNQKDKRLEKVEIELQVPPEFPEKYEKAVLRSMGLCAVKKAIFDPPEIESSLVRGEG